MIETILKSRLAIIEEYEGKLKEDKEKLSYFTQSLNEQVAEQATEMDTAINEFLLFTSQYKEELGKLLEVQSLTMDKYEEKMSPYDEKLWRLLATMQEKEDAIKKEE